MFWNVQVKESKKTCKALLKKFLKCTLDLINRCLQNLKCSLFMLQDSDVELDGEFNKCVFFFLHSMTMHLFIFCCNWFSFGLETTDFLLVVCCTLLLCSKTILEHPTFIWGTVIVLWLMYGTCVDTVHPSKITTTSFCQEEFIFDLWLLSIWEMCMLWWCLIWWFHEKKLIQCSSPK